MGFCPHEGNSPVFVLHPKGVEAPSCRFGFPALSVMILGEKKLICFRSRPLLEPEKRTARFLVQGREAGAEPRARCLSIRAWRAPTPWSGVLDGLRARSKQGWPLWQAHLLLVSS